MADPSNLVCDNCLQSYQKMREEEDEIKYIPGKKYSAFQFYLDEHYSSTKRRYPDGPSIIKILSRQWSLLEDKSKWINLAAHHFKLLEEETKALNALNEEC
uniref:HMG box domain-containing protein n=1 Tax=Ditylenchus dipsaci TaxID=166011 RepID=A0A915EPA4_9BILA